ncbi:MAG: hypothetical protein M3R21_08345 [Candidatus Dormibacteraeota bacterium]|nr:hypothetical protein [Candidatus Dormibacteraeota bacterium]
MPEIEYVPDKRIPVTAEQLATWGFTQPSAVLTATGPCAACGHDFSVPIVADIVSTIAAAGESTVPAEERTTRRFGCGCAYDHPNRPASIPGGCGRWWLAAVVQDKSGNRSLIPAPDQGLAAAASALDSASRDELTAVRGWAEKWLPAVAALYGLFGLASIVVGKDALEHVPTLGRVVVAVLVILGLGSTTGAIWFGYRAAFGWMTLQKVENDADLEKWYLQRRAAIAAAPPNLGRALIGAGAALALLMLAVGVIWFWPPSDPPSPLVEVSYNQDGDSTKPTSVCGKLVNSEAKELTIQSAVGATKQPIAIKVAWVEGVTPKDAC